MNIFVRAIDNSPAVLIHISLASPSHVDPRVYHPRAARSARRSQDSRRVPHPDNQVVRLRLLRAEIRDGKKRSYVTVSVTESDVVTFFTAIWSVVAAARSFAVTWIRMDVLVSNTVILGDPF